MTSEAPSRVVYLDPNATTPVAPEVADAMESHLCAEVGSFSERPRTARPPGGRGGTLARRCPRRRASEEGVFTSGGTLSGNLAIRDVVPRAPAGRLASSPRPSSTGDHGAAGAPRALVSEVTQLVVPDSGTLDIGTADAAHGETWPL
jgi:cysteine desulfurase